MGSDRRYKGLLLDEADFALPRNCNMDALENAVIDYVMAEFTDEFDYPLLEFIGVASESLGQTTAFCDRYSRSIWVKPDVQFQDIFLAIARKFDIPEPLAFTNITTGRTDDLAIYFENQIKAHIDNREYYRAKLLMEHLSCIQTTGILAVYGADSFDTRGNNELIDFRVDDYGPGRRILVEIAFNWGQ